MRLETKWDQWRLEILGNDIIQIIIPLLVDMEPHSGGSMDGTPFHALKLY